ncbi:MAG: hypothetical protein KF894_21220 [Labilithrix sp.]|nr:hypothetical protein [Labilithrix sp.]
MTTLAHSLPPAVPSVVDRARTAFGALLVLARDHGRLDQVLVMTQAINAGTVARAVQRFSETDEGRRLFAERPRIDRAHVDFDALRRLPDGTLGREYTRFLDDNGISPDAFEELPAIGDERAALIMLRMRQTHDLWHVLTGYAPDVRGELLLQAFMYAQVRIPSALVLVAFGTLRWMKLERSYFAALRRAYRRGLAASFLPTFRWEEHWETPVDELRRSLACPA